MSNFVQLVLTCETEAEARKIADTLLAKHLVACVKFDEIKSRYWWEDKIEEATETRLTMESVAENFDKAEAEIKKLHSYDTFVLQQLPLTNLSKAAQSWWLENNKA